MNVCYITITFAANHLSLLSLNKLCRIADLASTVPVGDCRPSVHPNFPPPTSCPPTSCPIPLTSAGIIILGMRILVQFLDYKGWGIEKFSDQGVGI